MTLAVYPLVYLPVAASLRSADPGQEEVARSLGVGRLRTFVRITLGQARGAILGGCLLVALVLLAEYGAFELLGYQTFTTEIFTEFNLSFSVPAACALSLVLVGAQPAGAGRRGPGRAAAAGSARIGPLARSGSARRCGWAGPPGPPLAGVAALVAAGARASRSAPASTGSSRAASPSVDRRQRLHAGRRLAHRRLRGRAPGVIDTVAALPVALLAIRHTGRGPALPGAQHLPGAGHARRGHRLRAGLLHRALRGRAPATRPRRCWCICYAIMFFPLALVGVKAAVARAPASLDEVARSLGQGRLATLRRVTLRLAGPGLAAAFCLVFLSVVTELTATLLLIPTGVQTLATQFWQYETDGSYAQAAPFALVMIAVAAVPSYVLGRFFDRSRTREDDHVTELTVQGLHKAFGTHPVLTGLDLTVPAGLADRDPGPVRQRQDDAAAVLAGFEQADAGTVQIGDRGRRRAGQRTCRPSGAGSATCPRKAACSRT